MEPTRDPDPVAPETPPAPPPPAPSPPAARTPPAAAAAAGATAGTKPDNVKRFLGALIDGIIAAVLSWAVGLIGGVIGGLLGGLISAAYWVVRDGLDVDFMKQRSLGKQLMKLDVVRLDGRPMDLETSVKRNWMFGLGALTTILLYIPFLGWALIPLVGLVALGIGLFECYKVLTDPEGRRWGDSQAGTKVVESAT